MVTIYTVRKQSQAPYIRKSKGFPNRLCIKLSQCVKIILHCPVTGWSDLSVLLWNRVKVKPVAQYWNYSKTRLNHIQEKHLLPWLLTEHTAVTICQYPGCKSPDSQYTYPLLGSPKRVPLSEKHEARTRCFQVSTKLPDTCPLAPFQQAWPIDLENQSLRVNVYRGVYYCSVKGFQLITHSSILPSKPSSGQTELLLKSLKITLVH